MDFPQEGHFTCGPPIFLLIFSIVPEVGETSDIGKTNKILVETIPNTICIGKPIQYIAKAKEPSTRIVIIVGTLALFWSEPSQS